MTESDKINGWTFEETVKTATNLMEVENNMFKWDVLRHLRDFAEMYEEEVQRYRVLGNVEELRHAKEKQIPKKPYVQQDDRNNDCMECPFCDSFIGYECDCRDEHYQIDYCPNCGQAIDWSDSD